MQPTNLLFGLALPTSTLGHTCKDDIIPELPEVETVRRGLAPAFVGRMIVHASINRPDLRWPFPDRFGERLTGRRVLAARRRAKFLLFDLDGGESAAPHTFIAHLGMTGRFQVERATGTLDHDTLDHDTLDPGVFYHEGARGAAHDHVVLTLDDGARLVYNDARRFGAMDLWPTDDLAGHPWLRTLGPEPVAVTPDALAAAMAGARTPLKAALLDQKRVAGLGNIYVCEALHRARLSPRREARTIAKADGTAGRRASVLATEIRAVLAEAIEAGGSTLRDYRHADGSSGAMQQRFRAYDREGEACPTPNCRGVIARTVQSGRSTFHCPVCQR